VTETSNAALRNQT